MKFKENNQICSPLKISQSINAESACDRNMYSCIEKACIVVAFMKSGNSLVVWCIEKKKTEDSENVFFKALAEFFFNMEKLFMAELLPNGLHEKVMICSIC